MLKKGRHEEFAKFFAQPTRETFRELIKNHFGELDALDFKAEWPTESRVAKHILAMANSGGGCIVFGVSQAKDNALEAKGLATLQDKADVKRKLSSYLPARLFYEVLDFPFKDSEYASIKGKMFEVLIVEDDAKSIPFVSKRNGDDIRQNAVYARSGTESAEADDYQLQQIMNRRIETGHSTAAAMETEKHVDELIMLYSKLTVPLDMDIPPCDEPDSTLRELIAAKKCLVQERLGISDDLLDFINSH